jgi:hypothetical protein
MSSFYVAQWEEHETHVLRTGYSNFGVSELQLSTCGFLMSAGVWQEIWGKNISMTTFTDMGFNFPAPLSDMTIVDF